MFSQCKYSKLAPNYRKRKKYTKCKRKTQPKGHNFIHFFRRQDEKKKNRKRTMTMIQLNKPLRKGNGFKNIQQTHNEIFQRHQWQSY